MPDARCASRGAAHHSRSLAQKLGVVAALLGFAGLLIASVTPAAAGQGSIPLTIKAVGGAQSSAAVFTGIPFPPGACTDVDQIELVTNGQPVARQVKLLSSYPDGSVRVALLGFRTTLAAGQSTSATVRYGYAPGVALSPQMAWTRNLGVLALCSPRWYGDSGVFGLPFLASADNILFPAFETVMRQRYTAKSDPPSDTNPDNRNYYDHVHALFMTMLRDGGPDSTLQRVWDEVNQYRENEIVHAGTYRGQYQAGSVTDHGLPIPLNVVRRMYAQGLLEDYYFSGDDRSLAVAQEIGEAFITDAYQQGAGFTNTERTPGWELIGLCALYEATLDVRYLSAARNIATIELNHQDAMAIKYPNQGDVLGQTGGFIQDYNGAWYDPAESSVAGAGSPFMTTLLCEGLIKFYWLTGDARTRTGLLRAYDWLADAAFAAGSDARNTGHLDSFWYIAIDPGDGGTTPSLNPMFLQMLGFAHQATGDPKYLALALRILAVNDWGNHIKEFNQDLRSSGQGLYLLQNAAGTAPLTLTAAGGGGGVPLPAEAPTNLTASPASPSQIDLTWSDNAGNEAGYQIERSTDGANFAVIDTVGADVTHYASKGLAGQTTYYYRVLASNSAGFSLPSNIASAVTPVNPLSLLSDNFDDNTRAAARWSFGVIQGAIFSGAAAWDAAIPVLEQNRRLEIYPRANVSGDHYNGYVSTATWDLTNANASVEVIQAAGGGTTDTAMTVGIDAKNFYLIEVESGRIYFTQAIAGTRTTTSAPYSPTAHHFWRVRHDPAANTILFETSADRVTWTTQRTVTRQLTLTAMRVELGAGTWQALSAPGTTIFDDFRLELNSGASPPANQPPVANPGGPYSGTTGQAVSFNGAGSSDPDGTIAGYQWSFGDSTTGSGATPTHTYAAVGTYTVTLTVTDNLGATATSPTTATINLPPNQLPVANAGGPYAGTTGQAVAFNGGASSDADGTIASYQWSFGDGGTGTGATPTHTYAAAGTYTVTLTVTDNRGGSSSAGTTASIAAPPVMLADDFNDNARDATKWSLGAVQATWDSLIPVLEQNQHLEISPRANLAGIHYNGFLSAATWNLTNAAASVEVMQVANGATTDTELALCVDAANFYQIVFENGRLYFQQIVNGARSSTSVVYSATQHRYWRIRHDPAANTILFETSADRVTWTTQRTVARQLTITALRIELSAGTWQALGAPGTAIFDNFRLESNGGAPPNQSPVANPGGPYSGTTGQAVSFNGAGSSDPDGTIAGYQWSFGDSTTGTGATPTHTYAAAGTYTVTLTVTDNGSVSASATTTATINLPPNQLPVANAGGPYSGTTGQAVAFNGSASSDPDGSIVSYQWSFGDATTATGATPTHTYAATGSFTVTLTVTDNRGGATSASTTATIAAPPPVGAFLDDFNDNTRDASKWSFGVIQGAIFSGAAAWDAAIPVLEQNQRLEITPRANQNGDHYNGYVSTATWNLTNASAGVEVVQIANGPTADTGLTVGIDPQNFYLMETEGGRLYFSQAVGGARSSTNIAYNATQHRYWRIRHDPAANTILFETSADRVTWTAQRSVTRQLAITAIKVELTAGTWQPLSAPGTAIFDNFRLESN